MATYTSNYGWTKPSGSDNVDISVLNDNLDDQDSTIHDAFLNMAPPFSESSTYAVDDIVLYGKGLYKCHTAVVTPGSWTGSTNWQVYKLSEGGGGGGTSDYTDLSNKPQINNVELSGNKTTSDLGINADNVMMSDGTTSVEDALDELNTITKEEIGNFIFSKVGKVVMANMNNGTVSTDAEGYVLVDGVKATIPAAYRPKYTVNIVETYANKRLQIISDGTIALLNDASATRVTIRFEATYLTN